MKPSTKDLLIGIGIFLIIGILIMNHVNTNRRINDMMDRLDDLILQESKQQAKETLPDTTRKTTQRGTGKQEPRLVSSSFDAFQKRLSEVDLCERGMAAFEKIRGLWTFKVQGVDYVPARLVSGSAPGAERDMIDKLNDLSILADSDSIPADLVISQANCDLIHEQWKEHFK